MKTQGRRLIEAIKRKPMTYLEMNMLGISVCPHKRIAESLLQDEQLLKGADYDGHTTWRVVAATKFTA
jgi:hypothetical protein